MKIGVLSDTHVHSFENIPKRIVDSLSTVDLIIHAGDFTTVEVLRGLQRLAEVKAVRGNMDSTELKDILPVKEVIEVESKRIGIIHGWGAPWGIEEKVRRMFDQDQVDIIVYGHSHHFQNRIIDNILFFNPGDAANYFGILTVGEEVQGEILSSRQ